MTLKEAKINAPMGLVWLLNDFTEGYFSNAHDIKWALARDFEDTKFLEGEHILHLHSVRECEIYVRVLLEEVEDVMKICTLKEVIFRA